MDVEKQTTEVKETNTADDGANVRRTSSTQRVTPSGAAIFQRVVWYITGFIVSVLAMRLLLQLLGANESAEFVNFIYVLSNIFASPFYGIFSYQPTYGRSYLEVSTIVAILVYLVVGWGVAKLATVARPQDDTI